MNTRNIVLAVIVVVALIGVGTLLARRGQAPVVEEEVNATTTVDTTAEMMAVKVFFGNSIKNPNAEDCRLVYPVERQTPKTVGVARAALTELMAGPTEAEEEAGYYSGIKQDVIINSLAIRDGVAYLDLSKELEEGVGGSCLVTSIRAQIDETLKQFPTVSSVKLSVEGRTEDILQP